MKKILLSLFIISFVFTAVAQMQNETEQQPKESATGRVISWYNNHLNYGTVTLLMTIESSFIPFPSEVIVPPAAYQACNSENEALYVTSSKFVNVLLIILFATYFREHGNVSTLVGRFIPAIRQLISIPAGLAKMHIGKFILFTSIGAACWNTVLAILGYVAHGQKDLIDKYNHELTIALLALCGIGVVYVVIKWIVSAKKRKATESTDLE